MDGLHGHAAFHERESLAVEVRKLRIVVPLVPDAPLEHQRIAHSTQIPSEPETLLSETGMRPNASIITCICVE